MFTVDPKSTTPVYEQLVECVLRDVSAGDLSVGDTKCQVNLRLWRSNQRSLSPWAYR